MKEETEGKNDNDSECSDNNLKIPKFSKENGFFTTNSRSRNMAKISSENTKPEVILRKALWAKGIRFRLHQKDLPGKPDIVIKKYVLAIFIDGEFWHGKDWESNRSKIKSNRDYWIPKIEKNIERDKKVSIILYQMGYAVFRFWSREILNNPERCVNQILLYIESAKEIKIPSKD